MDKSIILGMNLEEDRLCMLAEVMGCFVRVACV